MGRSSQRIFKAMIKLNLIIEYSRYSNGVQLIDGVWGEQHLTNHGFFKGL